MRNYELMVILDPDLEERTIAPSLDRFLTVVTKSGGTVKTEIWGRRRLAYEIKKQVEGIYAIVDDRGRARCGRRARPAAEPQRVGAPHEADAARGPLTMAGETVITVIGNLTSDPELRFTPSGAAVANFTVASTPRTFDRQSQEWKDGEALFLRCNVWRQAAENVAESLTRGSRVIVSGRLKQRSFDTKEGEKRTVIELEVDEIGPSLRYATAKVTKASRGEGGGGFGGGGGGGFGSSGGAGGGGGAATPGRRPPARPPGAELSVPGGSNDRTHVRSGGARRTPGFPSEWWCGRACKEMEDPRGGGRRLQPAARRRRRRTTGSRRRTSRPSSRCSAACCSARTRSPTSSRRCTGADFYRPAHQIIFDCVLDLYGRGEPADAITVAAELNRTDQLSKMGGAVYLHTLIASTPTAANAGYYAAIVAEQAVLRRLVEAGTRVVQLGYGAAGGKGDVDDIVDRAQQEIYDVTEKRMSEDYSRLEDILQPTMDELDAIASRGGVSRGVPTGIRDLDELTNGLQSGQMIVIAARPGVGKSTLGLDIARSASVKHHMPAAIFSLEMSKHEITMRLLSAEAKVPLHHMRAGSLSDEDWSKLARRMGEIADAPLYIDDSPNMTMMEIRAKARRLKQRNDLKLIVIDYLQLMTSGKRVESRQQEVSEFSRALKLLAKELEVPVIAMSQLNRGSEQRQDKKPMLSDLRESGSIEQDADMVMMIHREDMYEKESPRAGEADIMLVKHRNGPTANVTVAFQGHYSRFVDMAN